MRYPIGIQNFEKIRLGDYIYIDKTDMVYKLVNEATTGLPRARPRFSCSCSSKPDTHWRT